MPSASSAIGVRTRQPAEVRGPVDQPGADTRRRRGSDGRRRRGGSGVPRCAVRRPTPRRRPSPGRDPAPRLRASPGRFRHLGDLGGDPLEQRAPRRHERRRALRAGARPRRPRCRSRRAANRASSVVGAPPARRRGGRRATRGRRTRAASPRASCSRCAAPRGRPTYRTSDAVGSFVPVLREEEPLRPGADVQQPLPAVRRDEGPVVRVGAHADRDARAASGGRPGPIRRPPRPSG